MAIKYYSIPEHNKTVAILNNCEYDVINKIHKMTNDALCICNYQKYMLPHQIRETCKVFDDDVFDVEEGKTIAKKKLMDKYYRMHDTKLLEFYNDLTAAQKNIAEYIEKNSSVKC